MFYYYLHVTLLTQCLVFYWYNINIISTKDLHIGNIHERCYLQYNLFIQLLGQMGSLGVDI